jgi:branched-chain amino acid transport system ATP-binding protein
MMALELRGLTKSFGGLRVAGSIDLAVETGERRLIIGPNGAGKTTLFNLIAGELRPDAGSIALFGADITRVPSRGRAHLGVARTYQIITLFPRETLLRNVVLSLLALSPLRWNPLLPLARQAALASRAREALARVGLEALAERPLSETSYGERRRVELAMALAQRPRLLLLDEPFAGLGGSEIGPLSALIRKLHAEEGLTILIIEHKLREFMQLVRRVIAMDFGEVIAIGPPQEIVRDPRVVEAYIGRTEAPLGLA